jgi:hypothetical protein
LLFSVTYFGQAMAAGNAEFKGGQR